MPVGGGRPLPAPPSMGSRLQCIPAATRPPHGDLAKQHAGTYTRRTVSNTQALLNKGPPQIMNHFHAPPPHTFKIVQLPGTCLPPTPPSLQGTPPPHTACPLHVAPPCPVEASPPPPRPQLKPGFRRATQPCHPRHVHPRRFVELARVRARAHVCPRHALCIARLSLAMGSVCFTHTRPLHAATRPVQFTPPTPPPLGRR